MKHVELRQLIADREAETGLIYVGWYLLAADGTPVLVLASRERLAQLERGDLIAAAKVREKTRRRRLKREQAKAEAA